ncbi:hypothetical protein F53441_6014 [Fusarium austroafricanum]|uniref:Nephrocystin 3-like N-terminal domain-containing protein n=1 Tax=Fusarium austroafricanum TaxID=2364996 RepID=A0A8H4KJN4_9HYPO|nr:hypothetical protein F53441_6014 [Fusarium austroafricanum]
MPDTIITINTAHTLLQPESEDTELQIEFLRYRKIVDALLLEIPKTSTVDDILSRWDRQVKNFSTQLDRIENKIEAKDSSIVDIFHRYTSMQHAFMNQLQGELARQGDIVRNMDYKYAEIATMFKDHMEESRKREIEREEELRQEREGRHRDRETFARERKHYLEPRIVVTSIQLLGVLGVSLYDPWNDVDVVLNHADHYGANLRGQVQWLVQTAEFQGWLHEDRSSVLLADGCMEAEFVSPMSGFCCGLISSLIEDPDSAVAFFFAGLHTSKTLGGPTAIMRSLIAQLLLNSELPNPNLEFVSDAILQGCAQGHCRTLCDVFVQLIKQVPPQMQVFCIVDGITWYEQDPWLKDMHYVASMFEYLAKQAPSDHSGLVKVLLTSPARSISIVDLTMKPRSVWSHVVLANGDVHPGMAPLLTEY